MFRHVLLFVAAFALIALVTHLIVITSDRAVPDNELTLRPTRPGYSSETTHLGDVDSVHSPFLLQLSKGRLDPLDSALSAVFPDDFEFGLATAPAHVEDFSDDSWMEWGKADKFPFFVNVSQPERRLDFWSDPEREIALAADTGVTVFRMGVDWGRLVPFKPGSRKCNIKGKVNVRDKLHHLPQTPSGVFRCNAGIQNEAALARYIDILQLVRKNGMRVVLTLFHHSAPIWLNDPSFKGWTNPLAVELFLSFVGDLIPHTAPLVDTYVILNEPALYAGLVYAANMWPGRLSETPNPFAYLNMGAYKGALAKAFANLASAHNRAYDLIKELDQEIADTLVNSPASALISVAHNVAWYTAGPPSIATAPLAAFLHSVLNEDFMDMIADKLDIIGINYYGREYVSLSGAALVDTEEYSEAGRTISTEGFERMINFTHERYNLQKNRFLPIMIMENGIADETDVLRPSYLIEHLMVVSKALQSGIPVAGYVFWTISDNVEWADGYCPKFGIVSVNRSSGNLDRSLRPSYYLFSSIADSKRITARQRRLAWKLVSDSTGVRPFCRSSDGKETVREITYRQFARADWRFRWKLEDFD